MGRPSMGASARREYVTLRLSPRELARLDAVRGKIPRSEFIRKAVGAAVENAESGGSR